MRVLASILAFVVVVTGFETASHGHVPVAEGWHAATPHDATAGDDGLTSCSICRLAHETASGPVAPDAVSEPLRIVSPYTVSRSLPIDLPPLDEYAPRAPPCPASC